MKIDCTVKLNKQQQQAIASLAKMDPKTVGKKAMRVWIETFVTEYLAMTKDGNGEVAK